MIARPTQPPSLPVYHMIQDFDEKRLEWRKHKKNVINAIGSMTSRALRFEDKERKTIALHALAFYKVCVDELMCEVFFSLLGRRLTCFGAYHRRVAYLLGDKLGEGQARDARCLVLMRQRSLLPKGCLFSSTAEIRYVHACAVQQYDSAVV